MAHPYRWSVIGYESDIMNWNREDLQNYFNTYYAPNNVVVVMSGDLNTEQVKKMAHDYFAAIPARPSPRPIHTVEPEQLGEKRLWVKKDVTSPNILIAWHTPETSHPDYYAMDMLNSILGEGNSSRLYSALVDSLQLAVAVETSYSMSIDPGLLYIYAICNEDVHEDSLEQTIYSVIDKVIKNGIAEKELQKVKNRKLVDFYHQMETIDGMSNTIGTYELYFKDYKFLFNAPEEYNKITVADIQRVAAKYLRKDNRTVGILKPGEEE